MMDKNEHVDDMELLEQMISSLMDETTGENLDIDALDPEAAALYETAQKVITLKQQYPGTSAPPTHNRVELLTTYRTAMQNKPEPKQEKKGFFTSFNTLRWAAVAVSAVVLIGILVLTDPSVEVLSGASGLGSGLVPLVLLGLVAVGGVIWLIVRRKKP